MNFVSKEMRVEEVVATESGGLKGILAEGAIGEQWAEIFALGPQMMGIRNSEQAIQGPNLVAAHNFAE